MSSESGGRRRSARLQTLQKKNDTDVGQKHKTHHAEIDDNKPTTSKKSRSSGCGTEQKENMSGNELELNLPELTAPKLWSDLLSQKPSSSTQVMDADSSSSEEESEDEKMWMDVKDESVQPVTVEVKVDKKLTESEVAMMKMVEKLSQEIRADVSKLTVIGMIANARWLMHVAIQVRENLNLGYASTPTEQNLGLAADLSPVLVQFKESLRKVDANECEQSSSSVDRLVWLYKNQAYETNWDCILLFMVMLLRCKIECRICSAFDVPLVRPGRAPKKTEEPSFGGPFYFVEFFSEVDQRFLSMTLTDDIVLDKADIVESSWPVKCHYVIAVNSEKKAKDVTPKYCSDFLKSSFRRCRIESDFIDNILKETSLYDNGPRSITEDIDIRTALEAKPLPKVLSEFKNHPLYVLEKDLLKFEAVYPPDIQPISEVRGHKVFPRSAVHVLQGELNWIRQARSVKVSEYDKKHRLQPNEEPYKVVKARPKLSVPVEDRVPLYLNVFGYWQTEPYVPPAVVNGKIPRNEYGNVYMYQESMLPEGCAHLKLNGIPGIARQLDIQAVPAVVGWEFSGGRNHPLLDGVVVLKEHEDALREAWHEREMVKAERKEQNVKNKALGLWRSFVKSRVLLEKMKKKFGVV